MTFAADLITFLKASATITNLVDERIRPGIASKDTKLPYITFEKISDPPHHHLNGASKIANPTYQFNVWAATNKNRAEVAEALRNAMDGFRGLFGTGTNVRDIFMQNQNEDIEFPTDGSQDPLFNMRIDFTIWYDRAVPTG